MRLTYRCTICNRTDTWPLNSTYRDVHRAYHNQHMCPAGGAHAYPGNTSALNYMSNIADPTQPGNHTYLAGYNEGYLAGYDDARETLTTTKEADHA